MVSNRTRYVSESTTDDDTVDMEYLPNKQPNKPARKPTRTPKCFSKNALMARENRLKKKMYISSLENQVATLKNDNKKLTHVVDNQSCMIDELKKEVRYLKSILANSESIGKLIRAINSSTGMAVTTSLEKTLTSNSRDNMSKSPAQKTVAETKMMKQEVNMFTNNNFDMIRHPWEEKDSSSSYVDYPTPSESSASYGSPEFEELNNEGLLLDMDIPIEMNNDELLDLIDEKALESPLIPIADHNYHNPVKMEQGIETKHDEDVGICLHVSKNKVSLEFCPSCSDKALQSWKGES